MIELNAVNFGDCILESKKFKFLSKNGGMVCF